VTDVVDMATRSVELRLAFDRSFALPPPATGPDTVDLLALRVGGASYAVRLDEAAGIVSRRRIVPLPSRAAHLLGVAGVRGAVVPVFDLGAVLGHGPAADPPSWILLCAAGAEAIGLGFTALDGYLRLPLSALHADETGTTRHVRQVVRTEAGAVPVVGIPRVVETLGRGTRIQKER
jgi:purine-binding chemotaxis protein CheW